MVPSINGLTEDRSLREGDSFILNKEGADQVRKYRSWWDVIRRRNIREGDTVRVSSIRRGETVVIYSPFEPGYVPVSRRDHDWFSARAPEQGPSRRER